MFNKFIHVKKTYQWLMKRCQRNSLDSMKTESGTTSTQLLGCGTLLFVFHSAVLLVETSPR